MHPSTRPCVIERRIEGRRIEEREGRIEGRRIEEREGRIEGRIEEREGRIEGRIEGCIKGRLGGICLEGRMEERRDGSRDEKTRILRHGGFNDWTLNQPWSSGRGRLSAGGPLQEIR